MRTLLFALLLSSASALAQVPIPSAPADGATDLDLSVTLQWRTAGFRSYEVEYFPQGNPLDVRVLVANGASVVATDLDWATTYVWAVRGLTDSIPGNWSSAQRFTVMSNDGRPTPTMPPFDATEVPTTTLLQWTATGMGPFEVQIDTLELSEATPTQVSNDVSISVELAPAQSYLWRVRRLSSAAPSPWSGTFTFTTAAPPLAPLRVPVLRSPANGSTLDDFEPTFSWTSVPDASMYTLEVATPDNTTEAVATWTGTTPEATIPLPPGYSTLLWRVQAHDASRSSEWSQPFTLSLADTSDATVSTPVPLTPFHNQVVHPAERGIEVTWYHEDGTMPCGVEVVWTTEAGSDTLLFTSTTQQLVLPDTLAAGSVRWRVQATPWWAASEWSETMTFTIVPAPREAPTDVLLLEPANDAVDVPRNTTLVWSQVPQATEYQVEISVTEDFTEANTRTWATTSMGLDTLDERTRYWWRARAGNAAGLGDWSAPFSFVTGGDLTSVQELSEQSDWTVWPNPSNGMAITLQSANELRVPVMVDIVNLAGERVASVRIDAGSNGIILPAAHMASGIYVAMIHGQGTLRALPIVITGAQR